MRIYTSENEPLDFCVDCFPGETYSFRNYANLGDGPDGRGNCYGYNEDHPPYGQENYKCETCKKRLTDADN